MHSLMVESLAAPSTPTRPAPALAAYSTSMRPASIVFKSAKMSLSGNAALSSRTESRPSALISGVPASTQSTPPATASRAISTARGRSTKSRATCTMTLAPGAPAVALTLVVGAHAGVGARVRPSAHTPITWTISWRSRGRASKSQKTMFWNSPRVRRPSTNGTVIEGPDQAGAHVRVAVAVLQVVVVDVVPVGRSDLVERELHVVHDAGLELEGRDRSGRARHEHGHGAVAQAGPAHRLGHVVGDLDDVGVAAARELDRAGHDAHESFAHRRLVPSVDHHCRHVCQSSLADAGPPRGSGSWGVVCSRSSPRCPRRCCCPETCSRTAFSDLFSVSLAGVAGPPRRCRAGASRPGGRRR